MWLATEMAFFLADWLDKTQIDKYISGVSNVVDVLPFVHQWIFLHIVINVFFRVLYDGFIGLYP